MPGDEARTRPQATAPPRLGRADRPACRRPAWRNRVVPAAWLVACVAAGAAMVLLTSRAWLEALAAVALFACTIGLVSAACRAQDRSARDAAWRAFEDDFRAYAATTGRRRRDDRHPRGPG